MTDTKLIAIGVDKKGEIWRGHFGIALQYNLYNSSGDLVEERKNPYGVGSGEKHTHHDDPQLIVKLLSDCRVFIAHRMGDKSKQKLAQKLGVETVLTEEKNPQIALKNYLGN